MPNVFTVKSAENHLDKIGSQLLHHSWVANSGKNSIDSTITSKISISQSIDQHNTNSKMHEKKTFIWCGRYYLRSLMLCLSGQPIYRY